jgi:hypothetical protein
LERRRARCVKPKKNPRQKYQEGPECMAKRWGQKYS